MEHPLPPPATLNRAEESAVLTDAAQPEDGLRSTCHHESSPPTFRNPVAFSFPTLNIDGSLSDLPTKQTPNYPPTPPAALSSLGARLNMDSSHADLASVSSLDDQYDMVDDISDISNDDRETASLASSQPDAEHTQYTPDGSVVDLKEDSDASDLNSRQNIARPVHDAQVHAANALLDSYLSEDLETPRQSLLHHVVSHRSSGTAEPSKAESFTAATLNAAQRILFVSESTVTDDAMSDVCLRIASCLLPEGQNMDNPMSRFTRLPPTPAGINPPSALFVRVGEIELVIDHCTGATSRDEACDPSSCALHIQDADGLDSSVFTVGGDKIALKAPDLVVFYLQAKSYPTWFDIVKLALSTVSPPAITIAASGVHFDDFTEGDMDRIDQSDLVFTDEQFFRDDEDLRAEIQHLMAKESGSTKPVSTNSRDKQNRTFVDCLAQQLPFSRNTGLLSGLLIFLSCLPIILAMMTVPYFDCAYDIDRTPEIELRRQALSTALMRVTNSTNVAVAYNISHLLPFPDSSWQISALAPPEVRYQGGAPNHIVISLPKSAKSHRFPTVVSTHAHKKDGRLDFNQTQLIDGVYDITLHEDDAHGRVTISMDTNNPAFPVLVEHNFGNTMLYRKKYEKASMEVSKAINKDVMVARKNVKSLSNKLGLELNAGAAATKNVTSELAIYLARDLQVLANTAVSVFAKAAAASNETAATIKKELIVIQKDFVKLRGDVHKSLISTADTIKALIPTTETFKKPLALSKRRARRIKDLLARRKDGDSTSPPKKPSRFAFGKMLKKVDENTNKAGRVAKTSHSPPKPDHGDGKKNVKPQAATAKTNEAKSAPLATKAKRTDLREDLAKMKERLAKSAADDKKELLKAKAKGKKGKGKGKGQGKD